eukprot:5736399-Alexandrium_andersonii.AAC.1
MAAFQWPHAASVSRRRSAAWKHGAASMILAWILLVALALAWLSRTSHRLFMGAGTLSRAVGRALPSMRNLT